VGCDAHRELSEGASRSPGDGRRVAFGLGYLVQPEALGFAAAALGLLALVARIRAGWSVSARCGAALLVTTGAVAIPYMAYLSTVAGGFRWESQSSFNSVVSTRLRSGMTVAEATRGSTPGGGVASRG